MIPVNSHKKASQPSDDHQTIATQTQQMLVDKLTPEKGPDSKTQPQSMPNDILNQAEQIQAIQQLEQPILQEQQTSQKDLDDSIYSNTSQEKTKNQKGDRICSQIMSRTSSTDSNESQEISTSQVDDEQASQSIAHQNGQNQQMLEVKNDPVSKIETCRNSEVENYEEEEIKKYLMLDPKDRTTSNIAQISKFFAKNRFFQEVGLKYEKQTLTYLYRNMHLEEFCAGETVFSYGDQGSHFYIIMEGEVQLKTPSPVELDGQQATPEGLLLFIVEYFHDIYWDKTGNNGNFVRDLFLRELASLGVKLDFKDRYETRDAIETLDQAIQRNRTHLHTQIYKALNPKQAPTLTLMLFKIIARISKGFSFGELALLSNEGRAGTVICAENCVFATLARKDYIWTIGQEERRKLKQIVSFFRSFRLFSNIRGHVIEKVYQGMVFKEFKRGQHVFRESQDRVDGIYFVVDGEFEVSQRKDSQLSLQKSQLALKVLSQSTDKNRHLKYNQAGTNHQTSMNQDKHTLSDINKLWQDQQRNLINSQKSLRTRSEIMYIKMKAPAERKFKESNNMGESIDGLSNVHQRANQIIRLFLLGKNEIFGLEEIIDNLKKRKLTVQCASTNASVYFLSKEKFIHNVNQFQLSDAVLQEQLVKHRLYSDRLQQTDVFQDKFLREQKKRLMTLLTYAKSQEKELEVQQDGGEVNNSVIVSNSSALGDTTTTYRGGDTARIGDYRGYNDQQGDKVQNRTLSERQNQMYRGMENSRSTARAPEQQQETEIDLRPQIGDSPAIRKFKVTLKESVSMLPSKNLKEDLQKIINPMHTSLGFGEKDMRLSVQDFGKNRLQSPSKLRLIEIFPQQKHQILKHERSTPSKQRFDRFQKTSQDIKAMNVSMRDFMDAQPQSSISCLGNVGDKSGSKSFKLPMKQRNFQEQKVTDETFRLQQTVQSVQEKEESFIDQQPQEPEPDNKIEQTISKRLIQYRPTSSSILSQSNNLKHSVDTENVILKPKNIVTQATSSPLKNQGSISGNLIKVISPNVPEKIHEIKTLKNNGEERSQVFHSDISVDHPNSGDLQKIYSGKFTPAENYPLKVQFDNNLGLNKSKKKGQSKTIATKIPQISKFRPIKDLQSKTTLDQNHYHKQDDQNIQVNFPNINVSGDFNGPPPTLQQLQSDYNIKNNQRNNSAAVQQQQMQNNSVAIGESSNQIIDSVTSSAKQFVLNEQSFSQIKQSQYRPKMPHPPPAAGCQYPSFGANLGGSPLNVQNSYKNQKQRLEAHLNHLKVSMSVIGSNAKNTNKRNHVLGRSQTTATIQGFQVNKKMTKTFSDSLNLPQKLKKPEVIDRKKLSQTYKSLSKITAEQLIERSFQQKQKLLAQTQSMVSLKSNNTFFYKFKKRKIEQIRKSNDLHHQKANQNRNTLLQQSSSQFVQNSQTLNYSQSQNQLLKKIPVTIGGVEQEFIDPPRVTIKQRQENVPTSFVNSRESKVDFQAINSQSMTNLLIPVNRFGAGAGSIVKPPIKANKIGGRRKSEKGMQNSKEICQNNTQSYGSQADFVQSSVQYTQFKPISKAV